MVKLRVTNGSTISFKNCQNEQCTGTLLKLSRLAVVFEVYNPYSIVQSSEVLSEMQLWQGDRVLYRGKAVVTNLVSTGLMLIVTASLVDPWSDLEGLSPGEQLREEVSNFISDWTEKDQKIEPSYKNSVTSIRNFLLELSRWLEHGELVSGIQDPETPDEFKHEFVADVESSVYPQLVDIFGKYEEECEGIRRNKIAIHKAFAQRELHPLVLCSPYIHRTFSKPLGYAGDYEMVNMILQNSPEGNNTFAKVINFFPIRVETAQAHRNRIDQLVKYLEFEHVFAKRKEKTFRVLNVGCGPAIELQRYLQSKPSGKMEVDLVDFNEQTLEYTKSKVTQIIKETGVDAEVNFVLLSINDWLRETQEGEKTFQTDYDFAYCAGLFDYFGDGVCSKLIERFYESVIEEGKVVVTNVDRGHPSKGFMEHLLDWSLQLRNQTDMKTLIPELGKQTVFAEATGYNIFLEIFKPVGER